MIVKINLIFYVAIFFILAIKDVAASGVILGRGYVSSTGVTLPNSCLKVGEGKEWTEHIEFSNPLGGYGFKRVNSAKDLSDLLAISGGISAVVGGWGAELSGGTSSNSSSNTGSSHLMYVQQFKQTATLKLNLSKNVSMRDVLTDRAKELYDKKDGGEAFFKLCGDKYIKSASAGGMVMLDVDIRFKSNQDQSSFEAAARVSGNVSGVTVGVSAGLKMAEKSAKNGAEVTLTGVQHGGNPAELTKIFGESSPSGEYQIQVCGSSGNSTDPAKCEGLANNIIAYGESFPSQIKYTIKGQMDNDSIFYSSADYGDYKNTMTNVVGEPYHYPSENIVKQIEANYNNLTQNIAISKEYQLFVNNFDNTANFDSMAISANEIKLYSEDILQKLKDFYTSNKNLKRCVNELNNDSCISAQKAITNQEKILTETYDPLGVEELLFKHIKNDNFSVSYFLFLHDIKDLAHPKFEYRNCSLRPIGSEDMELYVLTDCGLQDATINLKRDYVNNTIKVSGFSYDDNIEGNKYHFKYPEMIFTAFGDKMDEVYHTENIEMLSLIKYAKCANTICSEDQLTMTQVSEAQLMSRLKNPAIFINRKPLISVYPNLKNY